MLGFDSVIALQSFQLLEVNGNVYHCHCSKSEFDSTWFGRLAEHGAALSEAQVADLMTKIVAAAQETGLLDRFYNDIASNDQLATDDLVGSSSV